jgi:hypothetical protein
MSMRRQQNSDGFNKEKFAFLVASFVFAWGTYEFLSTGPVALTVGNPITSQPGPGLPRNQNADQPAAENFYVVTGSKTRMIDPMTQQLVNRDRKSPFTRADWVSAAPAVAKGPPKNIPPPPPPPPPPVDLMAGKEKNGKNFKGEDAQAEVEFVGVMIMSGQTYGMIKPIDGGPPAKVKVGDKIPDYNYTVTKIDKQVIWIEDENKRPFLLKDNQFIPADASRSRKGDDELDADMDPDMAPKKKGGATEKKGKGAEPAEKKPATPAKAAPATKPVAEKVEAPVNEKPVAAPATKAINAAREALTKAIANEKDEQKKAKMQQKLEALDKHNEDKLKQKEEPKPAPVATPTPVKAPATTTVKKK